MTLVDANVLLDVFTDDPVWADKSEAALLDALSEGPVGINPIIFAEISIGFSSEETLRSLLDDMEISCWNLPYSAAFPAGKAFLQYRKNKGLKRSPLPDFYIGAHAQTGGYTILTRDTARYKTYFPTIKLKHP